MLPLQLNPQRIGLTHRDNTLSEALFQELPLGILVIEAQGEIRFVNQTALNLLGLSESQLLGQTPVDPDWHIIQENGKPFQLKLQSVPVRAKHILMLLGSRQPLRNLVLGVYRPLLKDRIWLSVSTEPKLGMDGCVERVICTLSDITNLKAEQKLSRLHECF
jgi:PAS domain S-box-containing protein